MSLEALVRPFQAPQSTATRRIVPVRTQVPPETAGVKWGVAGDLPVAVEVPVGEDPLAFSFEVTKRAAHNAIKMETERVRVENPDDPNQYLITERIKRVTFKEKDAAALAAYPKGGSVTKTTPGASNHENWQPGETQVNTDGTGRLQGGEQRVTYPLKIEEREFVFDIWPVI